MKNEDKLLETAMGFGVADTAVPVNHQNNESESAQPATQADEPNKEVKSEEIVDLNRSIQVSQEDLDINS